MKRFDAKSLCLGALAGGVLVCVIGAAETKSIPSGRFQAVMTESKALIIDTSTGQAWMETVHGRVINTPNFYQSKTTPQVK